MDLSNIVVALLLFPVALPDAQAYLKNMASDDFDTRSAAADKLQTLAEQHVLFYYFVEAASNTEKDVEVRHQCATILSVVRSNRIHQLGFIPMLDASWYSIEKQVYIDTTIPSFWGNPLLPPRSVGEYYLTQAGGRDGFPWDNYRRATLLYCYDLQQAGYPDWLISMMLDELHERDYYFWNQCGYNADHPFPTTRARPWK